MALKPCPRCGKMISDKAERCPKCALDLRNTSTQENARDARNESQSPIIEKPTANEMPAQRSNPTVIPGPYQSVKPKRIDKRKKSKTGLWIFMCIILAVGIGAAIWIPIYRNKEKLNMALSEQRRLDSIAMTDAEGGRQQISQESHNNNELNIQSPRGNNNRYFLDEQTAINFITDYHKAVESGNADSFFEEYDIDFFDLKHVDKKEILKHLEKTSKTSSKHEYDWNTLKIYSLSGGEYRITFTSKYYIFYKSKTDIYRLESEFILSPNKKIRSIKDLETVKVKSIPKQTKKNQKKKQEIPTNTNSNTKF